MTKLHEVYKCEICGNVVEILHAGIGQLVCCGKPMILQKENSVDASKEKHVPIIKGKKILVGSIPHPMEKKHYIMWIEANSKSGETERVFLNPGDKPEAKFDFKVESARAYCNIHGLWKSK